MIQYLQVTPVASIIFIFTLVTSIYAFYDSSLFGKFMLHPYSVYRKHNIYTLFTSGLIHADWMHLAFNMFTFNAFAFILEQQIGSVRFAIIYIVALVLSDIPTVIKQKNSYHYHSLGASGAISAVVFSYIMLFPLSTLMIFPLPIPIWAILFGVLYLVYSYYMSSGSRDNINHDAHLFGALTGIILTILLVPGVIPNFLGQLSARFGG